MIEQPKSPKEVIEESQLKFWIPFINKELVRGSGDHGSIDDICVYMWKCKIVPKIIYLYEKAGWFLYYDPAFSGLHFCATGEQRSALAKLLGSSTKWRKLDHRLPPRGPESWDTDLKFNEIPLEKERVKRKTYAKPDRSE